MLLQLRRVQFVHLSLPMWFAAELQLCVSEIDHHGTAVGMQPYPALLRRSRWKRWKNSTMLYYDDALLHWQDSMNLSQSVVEQLVEVSLNEGERKNKGQKHCCSKIDFLYDLLVDDFLSYPNLAEKVFFAFLRLHASLSEGIAFQDWMVQELELRPFHRQNYELPFHRAKMVEWVSSMSIQHQEVLLLIHLLSLVMNARDVVSKAKQSPMVIQDRD